MIFVLAACLAGQCNRGIYRLAWDPRSIGPWSAPHPEAPPRHWLDFVPIIGWFGLRREVPLHGPLFWLRPMLIELALGCGYAALYWWEVDCAGLMPVAAETRVEPWLLHSQYLSHVLLVSFMLVATFIDFDEKTIPDAITVPGTLAGLLLMAIWPLSAPPVAVAAVLVMDVQVLQLTSPWPWPAQLDTPSGLWIGLGCFAGWCLAIWPRTLTLRRGWVKAAQYSVVSMFRFSGWWMYLALLLVGTIGIAGVWWLQGPWWSSLLSALVGLAFGGGLIWAVRIVGGGALGKEAMGFGDVTLMAMIGTYLGWQTALMVFFLAPFVAVFICLVQWMVTRRRDIAFGPYLCVAALILILGWTHVWETRAKQIFEMGWFIPQLVGCCLVLLAGMLSLWRLLERWLFGPPE
jgi:prepilin signal peptidase PulO-like enzyme (type II secretory pathway)